MLCLPARDRPPPFPSFAAWWWVCCWVALCCYDSELNYFLSLRNQGPLDPTTGPLRMAFLMVASLPQHACWGGLIWSLGQFTK